MSGIPVYIEPLKSYKIKSNQSKGRMYEVAFGEVDWGRNGETEFAIYCRIFLLKNGKWLSQNYPAHVLVSPGEDGKSDFDNVQEKLELLKKEFLS